MDAATIPAAAAGVTMGTSVEGPAAAATPGTHRSGGRAETAARAHRPGRFLARLLARAGHPVHGRPGDGAGGPAEAPGSGRGRRGGADGGDVPLSLAVPVPGVVGDPVVMATPSPTVAGGTAAVPGPAGAMAVIDGAPQPAAAAGVPLPAEAGEQHPGAGPAAASPAGQAAAGQRSDLPVELPAGLPPDLPSGHSSGLAAGHDGDPAGTGGPVGAEAGRMGTLLDPGPRPGPAGGQGETAADAAGETSKGQGNGSPGNGVDPRVARRDAAATAGEQEGSGLRATRPDDRAGLQVPVSWTAAPAAGEAAAHEGGGPGEPGGALPGTGPQGPWASDGEGWGEIPFPVRLIHREAGRRLAVRVDARELGPIHVDVQQAGERIELGLRAVRPETADLLGQHLPELVEGLRTRRLDVGQASVFTGFHPTADGRAGHSARGGGQHSPRSSRRLPAEAVPALGGSTGPAAAATGASLGGVPWMMTARLDVMA